MKVQLRISAERQKRFDEDAERLVAPLRKGSAKQERDRPTSRLAPARKSARRVSSSSK